MKYSEISRSWPIMVTGYCFHPLSAMLDLHPIQSVGRALLMGGLSVFFLMNPLHAESTPFFEKAGGPAIQWQEWGPEAFQRAQSEDKLIVLDLTAVWCHACHVMDQTTYSNPRIIQLLNNNFIPVRVDTDQRPDLEERYRAGGWPTTNLLLPTGEILFQANALESEEMEAMLLEIQSVYVSDRVSLLQQASQFWSRVEEKVEANPSRGPELQDSMVGQSIEIMKKQFDIVNGGFRVAPKFFEPEAIRMVFAQGFLENEPVLIKMGLDTLEKQASLLDPVWGGFYRYAEKADWSQPHFEKMLTIQARNLHNYVEAFQLTGDRRFERIAVALIEYVSQFLTDPHTGLFYESQDADVRGAAEESLVPGAEYYSLREGQRLAIGLPPVDQRIFTGSNALMAWAYLQAAPVLGKPEIQERALQALNRLFEQRFEVNRGLAHLEMEEVSSLYGLLSDHILFGQALLEAFSSTGQSKYLQNAEALAEANRKLLQDSVHGGFFDHPRASATLGLLKVPTKPVTENLQASMWYLRLFHVTGKQEYRSTAERTLQAMVTSGQPLPIALTGLAIQQWFQIPVHIAVVGIPGDPSANALLLESRRLYCSGKIVRVFDPLDGQPQWGDIVFPYDGRPVAFVCTDRMCLAPIFLAKGMKESIDEMLAVLKDPLPEG